MLFNDLSFHYENQEMSKKFTFPTVEHIKALDILFEKKLFYKPIIFHCHAGISRSAALAYVSYAYF